MTKNPLLWFGLLGLGLYGAHLWANSNAAKALHSRRERIKQLERETDAMEIPSQEEPSVVDVSGRRRLVWASKAMRDGFARAGAPAGWLDIRTDDGGAVFELITRESDFFLDARNGSHYGIYQGDPNAWKNVGVTLTDSSAIPADVQAESMALYIRSRYNNPARALAFHDDNNWF